MLPHFNHLYQSATEYIESIHMDKNRTWGLDVEILILAHMLHTYVLCHPSRCTWDWCGPHNVDWTLSSDIRHVYVHSTPTASF